MINKRKVAVLGVVFPKVKKFLSQYLLSLEKQAFKDFDLILVNDGLADLNKIILKYDLNIVVLKYHNTPAKIREFGINHIKKQGYEYLVFTDSDDFFSVDRIKLSVKFLKKYEIVVNDCTLVSGRGNIIEPAYFSRTLKNRSNVDYGLIREKNLFGFSNTAIRLKNLRRKINFAKDLIGVDWYLFSKLLLEKRRAVFVNKALTFYRIYQGNTVGLNSYLDKRKIETGIRAKIAHYKAISEIDALSLGLYKKFIKLQDRMKDEAFNKIYSRRIRSLNMRYPLWWEQIRLPEELCLCRSN